MLERCGKVKATVVPDRSKETLQGNIVKNIAASADVFTDDLLAYCGLHESIQTSGHQPMLKNMSVGKVHTNGMENFWSLLKRGLTGTYIKAEPFHLFRYIDEQAPRYNSRKGMRDEGCRPLRSLHRASGWSAAHLQGTDGQNGGRITIATQEVVAQGWQNLSAKKITMSKNIKLNDTLTRLTGYMKVAILALRLATGLKALFI